MAVKLIILLVVLHLGGCSFAPHILYKIDVQQGNVITQEMVEKLRPDMTKAQVRFVMGSPLIVDAFRNDRWDYVYVQRKKGDLVEQKRLTIFFQNDRLIKTEKHKVYPERSVQQDTTKKSESQDGITEEAIKPVEYPEKTDAGHGILDDETTIQPEND